MIAEPGVTHKCRAKVHAGIRPDKQKGLAGSRRQGLQKIHNRRRIVAATVSEPGRRERAAEQRPWEPLFPKSSPDNSDRRDE
jgi:hypothetical protein